MAVLRNFLRLAVFITSIVYGLIPCTRLQTSVTGRTGDKVLLRPKECPSGITCVT